MINVAFVCHCDKLHGKVLMEDNINIQFIDPWAGCKKWSEIENNSIDVIYTIGCPVYLQFDEQFNKSLYPKYYKELLEEYIDGKKASIEEGLKTGDKDFKEIIDSLMEDGFEKLKSKGKMIFPFDSYKNRSNPQNFIDFVKEQFPNSEFMYEISNTVPYDYLLTFDSDFGRDHEYTPQKPTDYFTKTKFLILTKINSRDMFKQDLASLGKDKFLKKYLSKQQFKSRMISEIEILLLIKKIKRTYPKVTDKDIISLFSKEPISVHRSR